MNSHSFDIITYLEKTNTKNTNWTSADNDTTQSNQTILSTNEPHKTTDIKRKRRRTMTLAQKKKLHMVICSLPMNDLQAMLSYVREIAPEAIHCGDDPDEMEIDLMQLSSPKLWLLDEFCNKLMVNS